MQDGDISGFGAPENTVAMQLDRLRPNSETIHHPGMSLDQRDSRNPSALHFSATCGERRHEGALAACLAWAGGLVAVHPRLKATITDAAGRVVATVSVNGVSFRGGRRPIPCETLRIADGSRA